MARVKRSSRNLLLVMSFLGVMSIAGALVGGVGGVMLALLSHTVLSLGSSVMYLMVVCTILGALATGAAGAVLVARHFPASIHVGRRLATTAVEQGHPLTKAA